MKLSEKKNAVYEFIGDSITHGARGLSMDCNHIMGHGYQEMAAAEIGRTYFSMAPRFINKGVSGQGLFDMAKKWKEDVLAFRPDVLTILIGVNDGGRYAGAKEEWEKTYREILTETKKELPDTLIILMEPFFFSVTQPKDDQYREAPHVYSEPHFNLPGADRSPEDFRKHLDAVNDMRRVVRELAKEYGLPLIPSHDVLSAPMENAPTQYIVWDGVHPSIVGHRFLADAWLETVRPYL